MTRMTSRKVQYTNHIIMWNMYPLEKPGAAIKNGQSTQDTGCG